MKKLIIALLLLSPLVFIKANPTNEELEAAVSAYYTGCMGGIIATIEEDLFIKANNQENAVANFLRLKANCLKQQQEYKEIFKNKKKNL